MLRSQERPRKRYLWLPKYHSAIGVTSHASKAILENGWMVRRFFTAPYRLNDTASAMETIGKDPSS